MVIREEAPVEYERDSAFSKALWDLQATPMLGLAALTVVGAILWKAMRGLVGSTRVRA